MIGLQGSGNRAALYRFVVWIVVVCAGVLIGVGVTRYPQYLALLLIGVAALPVIASPVLLVGAFAAFVPWNEFSSIPGVGTASKLVGLTLAAGWVFYRLRTRQWTVLNNRYLLPLSLAILWSIASVLWSVDPTAALDKILSLVQLGFLYLIIVDLVQTSPRLHRIIRSTFLLSAGVLAAYGASMISANESGVSRLIVLDTQGPAHLAATLLPAATILFGFTMTGYKRWVTVGAGAATVFLLLIIFSTGTLSALVGFGVALLGAVFVTKRFRMVTLIAAVLVSVAVLAISQSTTSFVLDRVELAGETGGQGRLNIWAVGVTILQDNPVVGVGLGNFPVAFDAEAIMKTTHVRDNRGLYPGRAPHNLALQLSVELGVVGLLLWLSFLLRLLWDGWIAVRQRGEDPILLGLVLAYSALLTQSFFLDLFYRKYLWLTVALLGGYLGSLKLGAVGTDVEHAGTTRYR